VINEVALAELAKLKQGARATWAAGDFPAIAQRQIWEVGERVVSRIDVRPGEDVLVPAAASADRRATDALGL
jgi:hypothetical protein